MRLKHIHLAGFKSFVDPVTIPAPARLTGIVGPNGCGKSNVIDAVRWVLGESKARELRGESMQDVIFNGSANRKAASRASVEMLFDNAEGRAQGQWAQYAEISVKRVLTRNGESSYYINNLHVRRRDVYDLFLGTGLGGDAYAIIEQGMISRVIESRPEELRGYLEEAAGVSKYKERRRETEGRLRDTRDNLARVEDIRQELGGQIERLTVQADTARRFIALSEEKTLHEGLLAFLRKRAAQARQQALARDAERQRTAIEAAVAELRALESALEAAHLDQFSATEGVNQAQARFYAEGGEAARLEQALRHRRETRERLSRDLQRQSERAAEARAEHESLRLRIEQAHGEADRARRLAADLEAAVAATARRLGDSETALQSARARVAESQRQVSDLEHRVQVEQTHLHHARRSIEQIGARQARLDAEAAGLDTVDPGHLEDLAAQSEEAERLLAERREELDEVRGRLPALEEHHAEVRRREGEFSRTLHRQEAELAALERLQEQGRRREGDSQRWLAQAGLTECRRLWQAMRVEAGWEDAVEAALGERLAALLAENRADWLSAPPEGRLDLALGDAPEPPAAPEIGLPRLLERVRSSDPLATGLLSDWLARVYAADDLATAMVHRGRLPPGGAIATPQGHLLSGAAITYNAQDKGHHGLLRRAREIEVLAVRVRETLAVQEELRVAAEEAGEALRAARLEAEGGQAAVEEAQEEAHGRQMAYLRERERVRRLEERQNTLRAELAELAERLAAENAARDQSAARHGAAAAELDGLRAALDDGRQQRRFLEGEVEVLRTTLRKEERSAQEAAFQAQSQTTRGGDLEERRLALERTVGELARAGEELGRQIEAEATEGLEADVRAALDRRQEAEAVLIAAREAMEGANARIRDLEAQRLRGERSLDPMRGQLQDLELKRQEAVLKEAQFAEALVGHDETRLAERCRSDLKDAVVAAEIERLGREIAGLGAVNLAALDELETTSQRKAYLDAQAEDLETAAATLEDAIRRIDAETRARLKATYDSVSGEFRGLFTELFGGGEAALILTGEEILDAGLVVMAQPPGKKNSSIHLLSGGEKALTALALVFAFFRLNPAPFCLLDEVDAPLDDSNTERLCGLVRKMATDTQFMFITHNRITMEMALHLIGITMPEPGVSRPVAVDVEDALRLAEAA